MRTGANPVKENNNINKSDTQPGLVPEFAVDHSLLHHKVDLFHLPDVLLGIAGALHDVGEFSGL